MENYLISNLQHLESFLTKNLLIMIIVMSLILMNQPLFWKIRDLENTAKETEKIKLENDNFIIRW